MPVPDFQSLMLPVLQCAAEGEVTVADCMERIRPQLALSDEEVNALLPSGKQTIFTNRTHWAKLYMSKAGLVESTRRGHFRITARGQSLLATLPKKITKATLVQFAEYRAWWEQSKSADKDGTASAPTAASDDGDTATPEERIEASHAALTGALRAEVLERVLEVSPAFFENLIIDLLVALGYGGGRADMGKAIGKSGDGGIDGIIKEDALGLDIVYIQAKRYSRDHSVGRPDVQSFAGSLDGVGATKGVFVTTSTFAKPAREFVDRISKRIVLIDGDELARLMIQHNVGVRVRNMYEVKKIDEDYFSV